jgi:pyruvate dehydrogenase complex dehydrogenase (E1) component
MYYREDKTGQILEEGINEAGAMCLVDRGGHGLRHQRRAT